MNRVDPLSNAEVIALLPGMARLDPAEMPTSYRVLAHRPEILQTFAPLVARVLGRGTVEGGLKQLLALLTSRVTGCRYCESHTGHGAAARGVDVEKLQAIWEFETDARFSDAERAALRLARDAALIPNAVTDAHFTDLRRHFSDAQIVEIVAVASLFGFLNRFNDTLANGLEEPNIAWAAQHLSVTGWEAGKHGA